MLADNTTATSLSFMDSLRGSSFTGQGHEDMVVAAMERMGFEVQRNVLLDNNTGQEAEHWLQGQWVRYVCAKEFWNGRPQRWWRTFQHEPTWEFEMARPYVTEVDVLAECRVPFERDGQRFSGFSRNGTALSINAFRQVLAGRWLIEISAPDGYNTDRMKDNQLLWLQHYADHRKIE